jgi:transketolase
MIDGRTEDVMKLEPFSDKWKAFGFIVKEINGHSFREISEAIDFALTEKSAPVVIIANTFKGNGIDFMKDDYRWHYGGLDSEKIQRCKESLQKYYESRIKGD